MKSAIKINERIIVFKSNKINSKGKDKLFFYNIFTENKIKAKIEEEYSFVYSPNGLTIMPQNIVKNKDNKLNTNSKILLCA